MAKKKRGMPTKTCVKCGKKIHARKAVCPKCGAEQPKPEKAVTAKPAAGKTRKPAAAKRRRRRAVAKPAPGGLPEAIGFVRQVGGLDQAKDLLNQIDEIKKL